MVSKKRTGNDPEATGKSSRQAILDAKAGVEAEVPGRHRGSTEAFYAGRRSLAYELVESGGFNRGRLGLEILYLLPDTFIEAYQDLYHRALTLRDESVMHGRSGGVEKAAGRTSMQLGTADRGGQAASTGKRWKNLPLSVSDEGALRVKETVDKELAALVSTIRRALAQEKVPGDRVGPDEWSDGSQGPGALKTQTYRCQGTVTQLDTNYRGAVIGPAMKNGEEVPGQDEKLKRLCGRFVKESWKFCPECGTPTET